MITATVISIIIALALTLSLSSSPLILGVWVLILALLIALLTAMSSSSWLGLIIFLIYVGGLLVIFAYFVALTPNIIIGGATTLILTLGFTILFSATFIIASLTDFTTHSTLSNSPLINLLIHNLFIILIVALVLFLALVSVVKVCRLYSAPLRPFN